MLINEASSFKTLFAFIGVMLLTICLGSFGLAVPPQIDPEGIFGLETDCIYDDFQTPLEIRDGDGDSISVYTNYGTAVMTGFYVDTYGVSHWHGTIEFEKDVICGESYIDTLVIDAVDEHSEVSTLHYGPINFVGAMAMSLGQRLYIWPDEEAWMPVYLDVDSCFCLGGYYVTLEFDTSVVELTDIKLGDDLDGHQSLFLRQEDYFGPELDRIIFAISPSYSYCTVDPNEPVLFVKFHLKPGDYPTNYTTPINFYEVSPYYSMNSIADNTGYSVWFSHGCDYDELEVSYTGGFIYAMDENTAILGDVNQNGYPWEAGDVSLANDAVFNYAANPLTDGSKQSGDCDEDGTPLTIYDAYYFWPVLNGDIEPGDDLPITYSYSSSRDTLIIESAQLDPGDQFALPVYLINHDTLFDFQAYIVPDTSRLTIDSLLIRDAMTQQLSSPGFYNLTSYEFLDCGDGCDSSIYLPGTYHICDIYGSVKSGVSPPDVAMIEFANDPEILAYTGAFASDYFTPVCIDSRINIGEPGLQYLPGDANMPAGIWPPAVIGGDVTYMVSYFRGVTPVCLLDGFYASADANGDCSVSGSDVTKLVSYFRGLATLNYCPDYPTAWLTPYDLPAQAPAGWPNCEE